LFEPTLRADRVTWVPTVLRRMQCMGQRFHPALGVSAVRGEESPQPSAISERQHGRKTPLPSQAPRACSQTNFILCLFQSERASCCGSVVPKEATPCLLPPSAHGTPVTPSPPCAAPPADASKPVPHLCYALLAMPVVSGGSLPSKGHKKPQFQFLGRLQNRTTCKPCLLQVLDAHTATSLPLNP